MKIVKMVLILLMALSFVGCVNPSFEKNTTTTYFKNGIKDKIVVEQEIKYEQSYFKSYKVLGFEIKPYDPITKTFSLKALYGHMESAVVYKDQMYHSDFGLKDISLFTATGSAYHSFYIGPKNDKDYFEYMTGQISNKKNVNTEVKDE